MKTSKKKRLEGNGWKVGSPAEFLSLSPEEVAYIFFRAHETDLVKKIETEKNPRNKHAIDNSLKEVRNRKK